MKLISNTGYPEMLFNGYQLEKKSYLSKSTINNGFKSNVKADLSVLEIDDVDGSATLDFFQNKKCLISGEFTNIDREDISLKIIEYNGFMTTSVIKSLDYFIIGEMPGYVKVEKVMDLKKSGRNIIIMDESEILQVFEKLESLKQ